MATKKAAAAKGKAKKFTAKKRAKPIVKVGTAKHTTEERLRIYAAAFVANGGNKTQAAISAGYSESGAERQGQRLSGNVRVIALIAELAKKVANKYELTAELAARSIVQELSFDPAKLYNADGSLKPITELDEDTRMALTAIEFEQVGSQDAPVFVRKVKWASRSSARDHLMKHLGMFLADNDQKPPTIILMEQISANPASRIKIGN